MIDAAAPAPEPFILNQSRLKDFNNCNRYYGWKYIQNLEPTARPAAPEIGIAVHAALASLHAGKPLTECIKEAKKSLETRSGPTTAFANMELAQAAATTETLLRSYVTHWQSNDQMWTPLSQELEFLTEIVPGWWTANFGSPVREADEVGDADTPCSACNGTAEGCDACGGTGYAGSSFGEAATQTSSATPTELVSTGIYLRGRADNLSTVMNALYLVDYKTASRMDTRDMQKYELDLQMSAYIYGLSKQLTEEARKLDAEAAPIRIEGVIIDLLAKTTTPQFARESYARTDEELEEFAAEFVEYARRIQSGHRRVDAGENWKTVFPKDTEACFKWGRACIFRDLCLKDTPMAREAFGRRKPDYVDEARASFAAGRAATKSGPAAAPSSTASAPVSPAAPPAKPAYVPRKTLARKS